MTYPWIFKRFQIGGLRICCSNPECNFTIHPTRYASIDPAKYCPKCGVKTTQDFEFDRKLRELLKPDPCFYQKGCGYEYKF